MSKWGFKGALAIAILAAGCSVTPTQPPTNTPAATVTEDEASGHYQLLGLTDPLLHASVTASSCRNRYFPASATVDGNSHTAWAPAWSDNCPSLTFDLGALTCVNHLAIKASGNVTFDVAVLGAGGVWTTVATGLTPRSGTFARFNLTGAAGTQLRLTFHGKGVHQLLVCGVDLCGRSQPTPTPTPLPSCGLAATGSGSFHVGPAIVTWALDAHQLDASGTATGTVNISTGPGDQQLFGVKRLMENADGSFTVDASQGGSFGTGSEDIVITGTPIAPSSAMDVTFDYELFGTTILHWETTVNTGLTVGSNCPPE